MPKTKEELNQLKEDYKKLTKQAQELSEEELENVTGGCTTYGNGWDGKNRPITTIGNSCGYFAMLEGYSMRNSPECRICKFYSENVDGKRISIVSAWCTNDNRIDN